MYEVEPFTDQRAVTAAGTPERLVESPDIHNEVIAVRIRANADNTGNIYVAKTALSGSITTDGYILKAGESQPIDVHDFRDAYLDLYNIWIDADVNGEGVSFIGIEVFR